MALVAIIQVAVLFVPESVFATIGIGRLQGASVYPAFVKYYIESCEFKNAMLVFWILNPASMAFNSWLMIAHVNNVNGYQAFLRRRVQWLKSNSRQSAIPMLAGITLVVAVYVWSTAIYLPEPAVLDGMVPVRSRFAMALVHGGFLALVIPAWLAGCVAEARAIYSQLQTRRRK